MLGAVVVLDQDIVIDGLMVPVPEEHGAEALLRGLTGSVQVWQVAAFVPEEPLVGARVGLLRHVASV